MKPDMFNTGGYLSRDKNLLTDSKGNINSIYRVKMNFPGGTRQRNDIIHKISDRKEKEKTFFDCTIFFHALFPTKA
jgi:hypothetical protein